MAVAKKIICSKFVDPNLAYSLTMISKKFQIDN
jgi:hypothetical protein